MARYADRAALEARFGAGEVAELLSRFAAGGGDADAALERQLADADSLIDSSLRGAYRLPLAAVPELLRGLACDLVRYRLYQEAPETVSERHAAAQRQLRDLAAGRLQLPVAPPASAPGRVLHGAGQSRLGLEAY